MHCLYLTAISVYHLCMYAVYNQKYLLPSSGHSMARQDVILVKLALMQTGLPTTFGEFKKERKFKMRQIDK